jgi:hypothetical protein
MGAKPDVFARLDRIKELWLELERTRRTSPRYEELIAAIHMESLAYQTLLAEQDALDRIQARLGDDPGQSDADGRPIDRRQLLRRKKSQASTEVVMRRRKM